MKWQIEAVFRFQRECNVYAFYGVIFSAADVTLLFSQENLHSVRFFDEFDLVHAAAAVTATPTVMSAAVMMRRRGRLLEGKRDALAAEVCLELLRYVDHRRLAGGILKYLKKSVNIEWLKNRPVYLLCRVLLWRHP